MILRARPLYRSASASIGTAGEAFAIQSAAAQPVTTHTLIITVDGLAFFGVGREATPPAPTVNNTIYLEANSTMIFALDGNHNYEKYAYIYAETGSIEARLSRLG